MKARRQIPTGRCDRVWCTRICGQFKEHESHALIAILEESGHFPSAEEPDLLSMR